MGKRFSRDVIEKLLSLVTEDEERKVILESDDPVYWGENHFNDPDGGEVPFKAKDMFYDFLRLGGKDRAGRIGRQAGKCEAEFTRIQLADGSCPTAAEIYNLVGEDGEFEILSFHVKTKGHVLATAIIEDNGTKNCIKVSVASGKHTTNTDNHPYLVRIDGPSFSYVWVEAKDLKVGMNVVLSAFAFMSKDNWIFSSKPEIFAESIVSIENVGELHTYAISVPSTQTLITDGFITHNTVHTTLDIMHTAAFSNSAIINVFVPEKKNMNRMLEIMANFLKNSDLKSAFQMGGARKTIDTKNDVSATYDYEIKVASGSVIRFFFMASKPDKARGQRATHLYVDEADYLPVKAFDVITGIVKGNLGILVTAISTPSGVDGSWFRNFCNTCSKNGSEFHISTKQEKNWPEIEARLRALIFDDVTWNLEVLAEWADAKGAVYKKDCIDDAINRSIIDGVRVTKDEVYDMDEYKSATKWLGVDWNVPQNGVRLVEIAQMFGKLWITRNHKISYENYTQTRAVAEVLRLHSEFSYKQISVDVGYGETQIELLMKALSDQGQDPKIVLNLVDSQKKEETVIEYQHPSGGRRRSTLMTRVKTKIVSILGKAIETDIVFFKQDDEAADGLVKEVRNFRRKGAALDGGFLYSENTHSLSALQIGMHGVDKWRRSKGFESSLCTEIISTISLNETIKRGYNRAVSIQSSPFGIGTSSTGTSSFVKRTGGLGGKTKRSLL